jgi:hypothetical protein
MLGMMSKLEPHKYGMISKKKTLLSLLIVMLDARKVSKLPKLG